MFRTTDVDHDNNRLEVTQYAISKNVNCFYVPFYNTQLEIPLIVILFIGGKQSKKKNK